MFSEIVNEHVHKFIFTEYSLPLHVCPDRFFTYPPSDKLPVFFLGLPPLGTELSEHPVCGQAGVLLFTACCGAVAARAQEYRKRCIGPPRL